MLNMTLNHGRNGRGVNFNHHRERVELNACIDFENAIELLESDCSANENILSKVKAIVNLLVNQSTFEYILSECFRNDNGGDLIRTGSFDYENYRITSIHSIADNDETYALLIKHFPPFGYLQNSPNTIRSFSIKRLWIKGKKWENRVDINIMGKFGREYNVKFNFFT